jgi:hypothetical protein
MASTFDKQHIYQRFSRRFFRGRNEKKYLAYWHSSVIPFSLSATTSMINIMVTQIFHRPDKAEYKSWHSSSKEAIPGGTRPVQDQRLSLANDPRERLKPRKAEARREEAQNGAVIRLENKKHPLSIS